MHVLTSMCVFGWYGCVRIFEYLSEHKRYPNSTLIFHILIQIIDDSKYNVRLCNVKTYPVSILTMTPRLALE